jgi:CheY-like chemotaxis protein
MRKTVLVIDDSMMVRRIVGQLLQESGYAILLAENGQQGYEIAKTQQPDLVLMDIDMPIMDGIEATGQMKADPATRHVPILIFTSLGSEEDLHRAKMAGCQGFLNKPICKKELQDSISHVLRNMEI